MNDWYAYITCDRCNRKASKYFRGKMNSRKNIGCDKCGQSISVTLKTQTILGPDIKIVIDIPYYGC